MRKVGNLLLGIVFAAVLAIAGILALVFYGWALLTGDEELAMTMECGSSPIGHDGVYTGDRDLFQAHQRELSRSGA